MDAIVTIAPSHIAYAHIPANELRMFVDGAFPTLAKNTIADVAKGFGHRYVAGHDLLLDVPKTIVVHGPVEGIKQAGHILITDFVTKAGIPIPGFSKSGLGGLLEQAGIKRGWMQLNICDTGVGILAISEGSMDLISAINGNMTMNAGSFFDTFIEGSIEVAIGWSTENLFLVSGGIENILAGIISTWNTYSVHINPLDFFGSSAISAILGSFVSYSIAKNELSDVILDAMRSGLVGALYSVSSAFGFGALAAYLAYNIGVSAARLRNENISQCYKLSNDTYNQLVKEICKDSLVVDLISKTKYRISILDAEYCIPITSNDGLEHSSYGLAEKKYNIENIELKHLEDLYKNVLLNYTRDYKLK